MFDLDLPPIFFNPQVPFDAPIFQNGFPGVDAPIFQNPTVEVDAPIFQNGTGANVFGSGGVGGGTGDEPRDEDLVFPRNLDFDITLADIPGAPQIGQVGAPITGTIDDPRDADLFAFTLVAGVTYSIQLRSIGGDLDPIVALLDTFGNRIASDDDSLFFLESEIVYTPAETARFLVATGGFFLSEGDYELTVLERSDDLAPVQQVALVYEAAFDRRADLAGIEFWTDEVIAGRPLDDVAEAFIRSDEFVAEVGDVDTIPDVDYVRALYENVLDRPADAAGLDFYLELLAQPEIDEADLLVTFALSPENTARNDFVFDIPVDEDGGLDVDNGGLFFFF